MNAIQEVKDENIRKIATTLRSSGLASSETEAVRMAIMMSKTSQKVTANFDERNRLATGVSRLNIDSPIQETSPATATNPSTFSSQKQASFMTLDAVTSTPAPSSSVRKVEVKEEFIFGEIGKEDVFAVKNEFEEVISQDILDAKTAPSVTSAPAAKQNLVFVAAPISTPISTPSPKPAAKGVYIQEPIKTPWHPPRPVTGVSKQTMMPVARDAPRTILPQSFAPVERVVQAERSVPVERPSQAPSSPSASSDGAPVSAAKSSQNAFSILLGSAQKNAAYEEEVRKHAPQQTTTQQASATTQESVAEKQPTVANTQTPAVSTTAFAQEPRITDGRTLGVSPHSSTQTAPHPVAQPAVSPVVKKPMMESTVDLTKMFNVNK